MLTGDDTDPVSAVSDPHVAEIYFLSVVCGVLHVDHAGQLGHNIVFLFHS